MIKAVYSELEGPDGVTRRLSVKGHANYAPAGQDIVCAGASILMQALVWMTADRAGVESAASDGPDGPRVSVTAGPGAEGPEVAGGFALVKAGLALLAERYPDNLRYADTSREGEACMVDLQMFGQGPALSREQKRQAMAEGTMGRRGRRSPEPAAPEPAGAKEKQEAPEPRPAPMLGIGEAGAFLRMIHELHRRWAREEAEMRRYDPGYSFREALKSPDMRRMMRMPGMRMRDAYRAANYDQLMESTARAVERGVVNRVRERGVRPAENGLRPTGAATTSPDVSRMSRAQREAIEREVMRGAKIRL